MGGPLDGVECLAESLARGGGRGTLSLVLQDTHDLRPDLLQMREHSGVKVMSESAVADHLGYPVRGVFHGNRCPKVTRRCLYWAVQTVQGSHNVLDMLVAADTGE